MNKVIDLNILNTEKKTIKNGFRMKPTVFDMLSIISDGNKAKKIEELIIEEYKKLKGVI